MNTVAQAQIRSCTSQLIGSQAAATRRLSSTRGAAITGTCEAMFRWASGGKGYIWLCLPYISEDRLRNQTLWWGDVRPTIEYCLRTVRRVCRDYGGDESRLILAGFSRGVIACNYLGLHTPEIARLWRAFVCYSHYDGVWTTWPYPGAADRTAALKRLGRLRGRPQFICHERSVGETRDYLRATGVEGRFEFHDLPFRNHNDAWTLRDIPLRRVLRNWLINI